MNLLKLTSIILAGTLLSGCEMPYSYDQSEVDRGMLNSCAQPRPTKRSGQTITLQCQDGGEITVNVRVFASTKSDKWILSSDSESTPPSAVQTHPEQQQK